MNRFLCGLVASVLAMALAACPGVDPGPPIPYEAPELPTTGYVWAVESRPPVEMLEAIELAALTGVEGETTELEDSFRVVSWAQGPVGPISVEFTPNALLLGPDESSLSFSAEADAAGMFEGSIDADGELVIESGTFPPLTAELDSGGVVTLQLGLLTSGSGVFEPQDAASSFELPLSVEWSCTGDGCFDGTCESDIASLVLDSSDPNLVYSTYGPQAVGGVSGATDLGASTTCSEADPAAVASLLGLPVDEAAWSFSFSSEPNFEAFWRIATVDKVTGAVSVSTNDVRGAALGALPTVEEAEAVAADLLVALGHPVPDPVFLTRVAQMDLDADDEPDLEHYRVRITPKLALYSGADSEEKGRVEGATSEVLVGANSQILGVEAAWSPAEVYEEVPLISPEAILESLWEQFGAETENLVLELGYAPNGGDHHGSFVHSHFIAPMWLVRPAGDGPLLDVLPASEFLPVITSSTPEHTATVDGSGPIPLAVETVWGSPPYFLEWESDVQGFLGTGESLEAWLSNGLHNISVRVTDARGGTGDAVFVVVVEDSLVPLPDEDEARGGTTPPGPPVPGPGEGPSTMTIDARIRSTHGQIHTGPGTILWMPGPLGQVVAFHLDEFKYRVNVDIGGNTYHLRSGKCGDYSVRFSPPLAACRTPEGEYEGEGGETKHFAEMTIRKFFDQRGKSIVAKQRMENLPGTLTLDWNIKTHAQVYGGPTNVLSNLVPGLKRPLGGTRAGVIPSLTWTYTAGEDGKVSCQDIVAFCKEVEGVSLDSGEPLCDIPSSMYDDENPDDHICCQGDERYTVSNFVMYATMNMSFIPWGYPAYASIAEDTPFDGLLPPASFERHDGQMDCSDRPWVVALAPGGDMFCEILPMAQERKAQVAIPSGGDAPWDNLHVKRAVGDYYVAFPGGNHAFDLADTAPTFHYHENWFEKPTADTGQYVYWNITKAGETTVKPFGKPEDFVNGDTLWSDSAPSPTGNATGVTLWIYSASSTATCGGNSCTMFSAPIFASN